MSGQPTISDEIAVIRAAVPSGLVFIAVMLLLRGYDGTVDALRQQVLLFAHSFCGGEDGMMPLLLHTLPLAIAAAVSAFGMAAGWIRFESVWSMVVLGVIVIGGAAVSGVLHGHSLPAPKTVRQIDHSPIVMHGTISNTIVQSTREPPKSSTAGLTTAQPQESAVQQLARVDLTAVPDLNTPPPARIEPLDLLPQMGGVLGIMTMAINQLLAFVVAYQPRVFVAAVLAGSWTGWKWQRRLATLTRHVSRGVDEVSESIRLDRAA
jgi:hypothetical protein